eukprot:2737565-Pyramimonas_sp.AAC.1
MPFHCRQKMHLLQHLVEDQLSLFGPPKDFSCYLDRGDEQGTLVCRGRGLSRLGGLSPRKNRSPDMLRRA